MLISKRRNFIFIHIYKNAGSSITRALLPFATTPWHRVLNSVMRRLGVMRFSVQPYPSHLRASELIQRIGRDVFDSYFSFAVVRNPWDWQVSLYRFMLKDQKHPQHSVVKAFQGFDDYIRWRCEQEIRYQKDFVYSESGELLVDFVGRFERLREDFRTICSRIGINTSLPKINVSNTTPYRQYYDETTRELVRKAFASDIELFGYDF